MYHTTTRRHSQKRKFAPRLITTETKKNSFLSVQTKWVCQSYVWRFCKNDSNLSLESLIVTRVIQQNTWLESSHHFFLTWLESSRVTENRDSSHSITDSCKLKTLLLDEVWYLPYNFSSPETCPDNFAGNFCSINNYDVELKHEWCGSYCVVVVML